MGPFAGADYNLTLSHSRLRSPAFPPQRRRMAMNVSPIIQKTRQQVEKGRVGGGGKGCGLTLCLRIDIYGA